MLESQEIARKSRKFQENSRNLQKTRNLYKRLENLENARDS